MTEVWAVPGYDVQALIGYGATGEVWRARDLSSGESVALKRLREGADLAAVDALRQEASVLRALDTPYVVRLRAVLGEGAETVLVLDLATGGSLASLLSRRGRVDPAEVVTIAAPLAQALAAAHACGLVHGDVTPSNVLFTSDGMPLLADLGLTRLAGSPLAQVDGSAEYVDPVVAAGGVPDEASDVWALGAVCHHLLSGSAPHDGDSAETVLDAARSGVRAPLGLLAPTAPRPLVTAIEQALHADPASRPSAADFARAIRRSHAAAPVRLTEPPVPEPPAAVEPVTPAAPAPAPVPVTQGTGRRRLLVAAGAVVVLLVAASLGWLSGRSGPGQLASVAAATPPAPTASVPPAGITRPIVGPDWRAVLDALDLARADAFAAGAADRLAAVYAPATPLLAADRAAMARLTSAGRRARGVRHTIRAVVVSSYDERAAVLRVVDELRAYEVLDRAGHVVQRTVPRAASPFVVRLVRTPHGWRLSQITPG